MCMKIKEYFKEKKARKVVLSMDDETIDSTIKIQGTPYDRKRKYDPLLLSMIQVEFDAGRKIVDIAKKFNMNPTTVRYNVDPEWKKMYNAKRNGKHTGVTHLDFDNRVEYKRQLVKEKKIKVAGVI